MNSTTNSTESAEAVPTLEWPLIVHIGTMVLSFCVLIPWAIIVAARRPLNGSRRWYYTHVTLTVLATLCVAGGGGLMAWHMTNTEGSNEHFSKLHHILGVGVMGLLITQLFTGLIVPRILRGEKKSTCDRVRSYTHRLLSTFAWLGGLGVISYSVTFVLPDYLDGVTEFIVFNQDIEMETFAMICYGLCIAAVVVCMLSAICFHMQKRHIKDIMAETHIPLTRYSHFLSKEGRQSRKDSKRKTAEAKKKKTFSGNSFSSELSV